MHSNFITPPDLIETVLVVDATEEQIKHCAEACRESGVAYNVYFYKESMNDADWLVKAYNRADTILQSSDSTVPILKPTKFGSDQILKSPADYFNK
jgi:ornithine cyclodeaminase/alanine dehydrogenase-like protein (mu-crystallin family)